MKPAHTTATGSKGPESKREIFTLSLFLRKKSAGEQLVLYLLLQLSAQA